LKGEGVFTAGAISNKSSNVEAGFEDWGIGAKTTSSFKRSISTGYFLGV
jgi:hypothetical protein